MTDKGFEKGSELDGDHPVPLSEAKALLMRFSDGVTLLAKECGIKNYVMTTGKTWVDDDGEGIMIQKNSNLSCQAQGISEMAETVLKQGLRLRENIMRALEEDE